MISDLSPSNRVAVEFLHGVRVVCGEGAEGLSQAAWPPAPAVTFSTTPLAASVTWFGEAADELPEEMLLFVKAEMR